MSVTIPASRGAAETKARIILAAQNVFSQKGYSHAGLREIAKLAEVAPSLVVKYFVTKTQLFEQALVSAILPLEDFQTDRSKLGQAIMEAVLDPSAKMSAPAMIALSLGDPESREVAARVVLERIIEPMAKWLGPEKAQARALNIFVMTTGFSIFCRNMNQQRIATEVTSDAARLFAQSIQAIADSGQPA